MDDELRENGSLAGSASNRALLKVIRNRVVSYLLVVASIWGAGNIGLAQIETKFDKKLDQKIGVVCTDLSRLNDAQANTIKVKLNCDR